LRSARAFAVCVALLVCGSAFADDPLAGIGQLIMTGHAAEARTRLTSARETFAAQGDRSGEAVTDLLLGMAEMVLNDLPAARSHLDRAASTFAAADEHFGVWYALTMLARVETLSDKPRDAIALHEKALRMLEAAADPQSRFPVELFELLGPAFGAQEEQLRMLAIAPELAKTMMIPFAEVATRLAYGQTLLAAGNLEKAEEQLTQAETNGAVYGDLFDALLARPMGELRKRQWRFEEARQYYEKALTSVMPISVPFLPPAATDGELLGKLAEVDVLTGHVDDALALNDRERTLALDTEAAREPWVMIERGSLLQKAGRVRDAETAYGEALVIAERLHDVHCKGAVHSELGLLHYYAGNYGQSAVAVQKAIAIFQELNEGKAEAVLWTLLADIHAMIGSPVSAAEALGRARKRADEIHFSMPGRLADLLDVALKLKRGEPADVRGALAALLAEREAYGLAASEEAKRFMANMFEMNLRMTPPDRTHLSGDGIDLLEPMALMMKGVPLAQRGDFAGARAVWSQANKLFESRDVHAVFEGLIAGCFWREGKIDEAIGHLLTATGTLEKVAADVHVEEMVMGYLGSERHQFYDHLIELLLRYRCIREAFEQTERARARAFLQMIGNRRVGGRGADPQLVDEADIQRRHIAEMDQSLRRPASEEEETRLKRELVAARHEYEALMVRVKVSNPGYAALTTVETVPVDVIQRELPDQTSLIAYFVSRSGVHAWIIDRETLNYVRLPIDANRLSRLTYWARQFGPRDADGNPRGVAGQGAGCSDAATADEAYAMLIEPLRAFIRYPRLLIVPHRELHYVPFAALHDAKLDRYLIEDYTIVYAPSASAWRFIRRDEPPVSGRALVLGDPAGSLGSLKSAPEEVNTVAGWLGTTALLGKDACERLIHDLDPKVDLLHIAAHAVYDSANPLFSFIALAPEGEKYDGNVEAQEILADVDLTHVKLVVVSACSTAAGTPSAGDEIVGLTRSLLYAGTPAVLSTLWSVNDVAATALMEAFYEQFVSGVPSADALREAQLSMLHNDAFRSPRFWAAFTLHGDPRGTWRQ